MDKKFISKLIKREGSDNILGRGVINLLLFNAKILPINVHKAIIGLFMRLLVHRKHKWVLRTNLQILYDNTLSDKELEKKLIKFLNCIKTCSLKWHIIPLEIKCQTMMNLSKK